MVEAKPSQAKEKHMQHYVKVTIKRGKIVNFQTNNSHIKPKLLLLSENFLMSFTEYTSKSVDMMISIIIINSFHMEMTQSEAEHKEECMKLNTCV